MTGGVTFFIRFVANIVGLIWTKGTCGEAELLRLCQQKNRMLVVILSLKRINIPSILTAVYRYPLESASCVAFDTLFNFTFQIPPLEQWTMVRVHVPDFILVMSASKEVRLGSL